MYPTTRSMESYVEAGDRRGGPALWRARGASGAGAGGEGGGPAARRCRP